MSYHNKEEGDEPENSEEFNDDTLMPFGKHKGERLADIEPSYFHYFWFKLNFKSKTSHDKLAKYINKNIERFKHLDEDLIWD